MVVEGANAAMLDIDFGEGSCGGGLMQRGERLGAPFQSTNGCGLSPSGLQSGLGADVESVLAKTLL